MSERLDTRRAISRLLDAAKTPTMISKDLCCARSLVYKVKKLKEAGLDLEHAAPPRKKRVLTPRIRAGLKRRIRSAPNKPLRRVAEEAGVNRETVRKVVVEEGWKSRRRVKVPLVSAEGRQKRKEDPELLLLVQGQHMQIEHAEGSTFYIHVDERYQHHHRPKEGIEEKLDGCIHTTRPTPDTDNEKHRDECGFKKDIEQNGIQRRKNTDHQAGHD